MTIYNSITVLTGGKTWMFEGGFQWNPFVQENTVELVISNVLNCLTTPLASQPLLRSFGLASYWIDQPGSIGQFQARTAMLLAIALWEPRANVKTIDFVLNANDVMAGTYSLYLELDIDLTKVVQTMLFSAPVSNPICVLDASFDQNGLTLPTAQTENLSMYIG